MITAPCGGHPVPAAAERPGRPITPSLIVSLVFAGLPPAPPAPPGGCQPRRGGQPGVGAAPSAPTGQRLDAGSRRAGGVPGPSCREFELGREAVQGQDRDSGALSVRVVCSVLVTSASQSSASSRRQGRGSSVAGKAVEVVVEVDVWGRGSSAFGNGSLGSWKTVPGTGRSKGLLVVLRCRGLKWGWAVLAVPRALPASGVARRGV